MRKFLWIAFAFVLFVGLVVEYTHWRRPADASSDIAKVESELRDRLPLGSSRATVRSYLDQRGIQHSYIDESKQTSLYNHSEMAMIRGASRMQLVRTDIQIVFKFDDHDRLLNYSMHEIFTGP